MKKVNGIKSSSGKKSKTNGVNNYSISFMKFPKSEDEFVCYVYNREKKIIEINFINSDSTIEEKYPMESCPVEICNNCKKNLVLDGLSFVENNGTVKLFCLKCCPKDGTIVDLYNTDNNNKENDKLIENMMLYLQKNKDTSSPEYEKIMNDLIFYTKAICELMVLQKYIDYFKKYISFLRNYIKNLSVYLEIAKKINMNNLYLFLRNVFIISTINKGKDFLKAFLPFYFKQKEYMNVSLIRSLVLEKIIGNKNDIQEIDEKVGPKRKISENEVSNNFNILKLKTDLALLSSRFVSLENAQLKKKIEIMELKSNIIDFLRSHNYSYYYISSKKVLERKFINGILFTLFKYHHKRFKKINEDEHILNSLQKELKNIVKFLGNSKNITKEGLKAKINEEIKFLEAKKEKINQRNDKTNNPKSEEEPKEESKKKQKEEPKEKQKKEPKEEPQEEPKEKQKEEPKEEPKKKLKKKSKEKPEDNTKANPNKKKKKKLKEEPKEKPEDKTKEKPNEKTKKKLKEEPNENIKEKSPEKDEPLEEEKNSKKIVLTDKEKALLNDYLISDSDESYTTIFASEFDNVDKIKYQNLQVILEFLFFIRDKTIDIIHLLNQTSSLFFEFLNQNSLKKNINQNEITEEVKNEINDNDKGDINESDDDDEDDYSFDMEELKKEFNSNYSKNYKKENAKLFKNLSVKPASQINCISALDYIFSNNPYNDYKYEINYLFEKFVLPNHYKSMIFTKDNQKEKISYYTSFQNIFASTFNQFNEHFKDDPLYKSFIEYYSDLEKKKKNDINPQTIIFYENNVENFIDFKELLNMKAEVEYYMKKIESYNETLKKMKYIKEKYKFIKNELTKHLNPNLEIYSDYYAEWKKKNWKFVVKDYELKDLIDDIKYLIPNDETMTIVGKDKKNFTLILYIFQNDYFLKDYI